MIKYYDGREYNTKTAKVVRTKLFGVKTFDPSKPKPSRQTLYRKRNGEYFLHEEFTYTDAPGDMDIKPIKPEEARFWLWSFFGLTDCFSLIKMTE